MGFSIAIDGPGGAGKSTVSREIAKKLGYIYVDTGAMYRSVALFCLETFIDLNDGNKVTRALDDIDIEIEYVDGEQRVFLNSLDVTTEIRAEHVGVGSSKVAVVKSVREKLVNLQRKLAEGKNIVMDGRDIGTFVIPDADIKIFLTASVEERAKRRLKELKKRGEIANEEEVKKEIIERDNRDTTREESPLRQASDAIYIDASDMSKEEVVEYIINLIKKHK